MAHNGEELLPETQPVKASSLHLQGDENVVEPKVQEPEKEDESKRKLGKALEDDAMAQHETQPVKASSLHLQGEENVVQEPEKEDESKRNVAEDSDGIDHSRKLLVQEKVGVGVKLGDVTESQRPESKQDEDSEANVAYSTKDSEDKVAANDAVDDGKVQANDVDVVVVETQPSETQTQTLVEPKFGEPEPDERNLGHSAKEADDGSSSKGLVQNLEEKVGVDTVDNAKIPENDVVDFVAVETEFPETQSQTLVEPKIGEPEQDERNVGNSDKEADENSKGVVQNLEEQVGVNAVDNAIIPEDDEVIDQFAQEENENGALQDDAMAQHELNKEAMAAAEASSSDSKKKQQKEFFLVLTDSGRAVLGIKGENGKFIASTKNCEVLKQGRQGNTEGRQFEGTTRIFLRPKIPPDSDKNEREEESEKNEREDESDKNEREEESEKNEREDESDKNEREEESEEEKKKKASLLQWLNIHKDSDIDAVTTQFLTDLKTRACRIGAELSCEFVKCFVILSAWEPVAKTLKRYENQTPPSLVTMSLLTSFKMAADHLKVSRNEGGRGIENLFSQLEDLLQLFQQALDCLEDALCGSYILETEEELSSLTVKESVDSADTILVMLKSISRSKMSIFNGILDEQLKQNIGEVWNHLEKENGGSSFMASLLKGAKYVRDKQVDFEESHPKITRYGKYFVQTAFGFPASLLLDYPKAYGIVDGLKQFTKAPRSEKKKWAQEKVLDTTVWTGLCYAGKKLKGQVPSGIDFLQVIWEQVPSTVTRTQTPVKQEQEDFSGYWVASIDEDDDTVIIDLFEEEVSHGGEKIEDLEELVHLEQEEEGEETFNDDAQV